MAHGSRAGFTLIELLVVLVILGLATAIAFPRLLTMYDSFQRRYQVDDVRRSLATLGSRAREAAERRELERGLLSREEAKKRGIELPQGWALDVQSSVVFHPTGACSGGKVAIVLPDRVRYPLDLAPPFCAP